LAVDLPVKPTGQPIHLVVDSTGLKGWIQLSSARFMNQGLFRQTPLEGFETPGPFSVVH